MSDDFRHGKHRPLPPRRKQAEEPRPKQPSKRTREDYLRHAVRTGDRSVLDEYDEDDLT